VIRSIPEGCFFCDTTKFGDAIVNRRNMLLASVSSAITSLFAAATRAQDVLPVFFVDFSPACSPQGWFTAPKET
jgi:hypothetical protein